jgi:hypothetical protein
VPRKVSVDDDEPRRRRGAKAMSVEAEHGLIMRIFLRSPKDVIAGAAAFAAISAIIANALFLQAGRHPAPMFGSVATMPAVASAPANPLPRPRPAEAEASEARVAESKAADLMTNLVKTTSAVPAAPAAAPRPPASVPLPSHGDAANVRRVAAVQRALTEYGYGQLKPTGAIGSDTQAAIQKFERARKLPVSGQVSDRLVRELTAMIGHPIVD